jgi:arylsulfatase A-like enzyme
LTSRRDLLKLTVGGVGGLIDLPAMKATGLQAASGGLPDVLLVGWDDVGRDEAKGGLCPRLAAFRGEAFEFANCWSHPACSQSRGAILFGVWGKKLGSYADLTGFAPPADLPTLPQVLQQAGYATALVGKWHCGRSPTGGVREMAPIERGYGAWMAGSRLNLASYTGWERIDADERGASVGHETRYATLAQLEEAETWWVLHDQDRPRFLHVALNAPHSPHHAPPVSLLAGYPQPGPLDSNREKFRAMLRSADTALGRLLDLVGPKTLVFLYSDNGTGPSSRAPGQDPDRMKGTTLRLGCHVLCLGRWRNCPTGTDSRLQHLVDIPAGILVAAGVPIPPSWDSGPATGRGYVLCESELGGAAGLVTDRACRTDEWLLRQVGPRGAPYTEELYDLTADPDETTPVPLDDPRYAEPLEHLRAKLAQAALRQVVTEGVGSARIR